VAADDLPREQLHGELMSGANANIGHCHECWKYTDDKNKIVDTEQHRLHLAVELIINGRDRAVEESEAFKAADAYLAQFYRGLLSPAGLKIPNFG
jgi:hypothetical protein